MDRPASTGAITKEQVFELAIAAGFSAGDGTGLSGNSSDDEQLYIDEYPVGEAILRLASLFQQHFMGKPLGEE